jgi:hypothetical protein
VILPCRVSLHYKSFKDKIKSLLMAKVENEIDWRSKIFLPSIPQLYLFVYLEFAFSFWVPPKGGFTFPNAYSTW